MLNCWNSPIMLIVRLRFPAKKNPFNSSLKRNFGLSCVKQFQLFLKAFKDKRYTRKIHRKKLHKNTAILIMLMVVQQGEKTAKISSEEAFTTKLFFKWFSKESFGDSISHVKSMQLLWISFLFEGVLKLIRFLWFLCGISWFCMLIYWLDFRFYLSLPILKKISKHKTNFPNSRPVKTPTLIKIIYGFFHKKRKSFFAH